VRLSRLLAQPLAPPPDERCALAGTLLQRLKARLQ
jgi:hypothetical protein